MFLTNSKRALVLTFVLGSLLTNDSPVRAQTSVKSDVDTQLAKIFGADCPELRRSIKLSAPKRGLMLTADTLEIGADGRLILGACSMVLFGKPAPQGESRTCVTARSGKAVLTLDCPLASLSELPNRKIHSVELDGGIRVIPEVP